MNPLIAKLNASQNLEAEDIDRAARLLLDEAEPAENKADFLKALAAKGETAAEIAGFAEAFLARAVDPGLKTSELSGPVLDVCGTGGDKLQLFNVSTTCVFVLAAAGIVMVKHGNRGITSKSGGADVLEALGVPIELPPARLAECVRSIGVGFLFAPVYHPAFRVIAPVRRQLAQEGVTTIFNLLGPLLNPVRPDFQLAGVSNSALPSLYADILGRLGRQKAWAVNGRTESGASMDELSTLGPTVIVASGHGEVSAPVTLEPSKFGFPPAQLADLQGGDAAENARILTAILDGSDRGPRRDMVLLNSAAGLVVTGLARNLAEGILTAGQLIDRGLATRKLHALRDFRP